MRFGEIPGQEAVSERLVNAVKNNRVSHALMLSGNPGCGHFSLAMALAQFIQCTSPGPDDSCGQCPSCHQASQLVHPDIHFVFPVARTAKITDEPCSDDFIELWREYIGSNPYPSIEGWLHAIGVENKQAGIFTKESKEILRKMSFKSFESDYKVVIFWMPEKMNATAANKLLKIIEEPADKTLFLFVTSDPGDILPTILSRTQLIKVPRIARGPLHSRLSAEFPGREALVDGAVSRAQGDYLVAREMIEMSEQAQFNRDRFIKWMRICFIPHFQEITEWVSEIADIGREKQKWLLQYSLGMLRNNFLLNQGLEGLTAMDEEEAAFSSRFRVYVHPGNIGGLMREFDLAISQIAMNANPRILLTDMSLQINRLLRIPPGATG